MLKDLLRTCQRHRRGSPSHRPCKGVSGGGSASHSSIQGERRQFLKMKENRMQGSLLPQTTFLRTTWVCAKIQALPFRITGQVGKTESTHRALPKAGSAVSDT